MVRPHGARAGRAADAGAVGRRVSQCSWGIEDDLPGEVPRAAVGGFAVHSTEASRPPHVPSAKLVPVNPSRSEYSPPTGGPGVGRPRPPGPPVQYLEPAPSSGSANAAGSLANALLGSDVAASERLPFGARFRRSGGKNDGLSLRNRSSRHFLPRRGSSLRRCQFSPPPPSEPAPAPTLRSLPEHTPWA